MMIVFAHQTITFRGSMKAIYDYMYHLPTKYKCILYLLERPTTEEEKKIVLWLSKAVCICFSYQSLPSFDILYYITHGESKTPSIAHLESLCHYYSARFVVHCVFSMIRPMGDIYAGVSEQIAMKYNQSLYVPHLIEPYLTYHLSPLFSRQEGDLIFGHYGGKKSINISWAKEVISCIVRMYPCIKFYFMNDECFDEHPSLVFLEGTFDLEKKQRFIISCDAMIMPESLGHSFGLSMLEFMMAGKPIIVYNGPVWNDNHLRILGEKAFPFRTPYEFAKQILSCQRNQWIDYRSILRTFFPSNVIPLFEDVFLKK